MNFMAIVELFASIDCQRPKIVEAGNWLFHSAIDGKALWSFLWFL